MAVTRILVCASVLLLQIHFGNSIRRSFGSSVAMIGDGFGSIGVINQGNGFQIDNNGKVKVIDGDKVVVIGDDPGVKVHKAKGSEKVKVIEGGPGNKVVYFGDGGNSVVMVGDDGGSVGMVSGGKIGNAGHYSSVVSTGGAVSVGSGGVSISSPGFVKSSRISASPFGAGAYAGAGANAGYHDADGLFNWVTSATGMGSPFWPF